MSELQGLMTQRDELLLKIRRIEENCEGIKNENNTKRVQELNLKHVQLTAEKKRIQAELNTIERKLSSINNEIFKLSGVGADKILEAIKKQRWYFFKNKPKVLMDRNTGLLWANLDYFPWYKDNNPSYGYPNIEEVKRVVSSFKDGDIDNWRIPTFDDFKEMIDDKTFPYQEGSNYRIKNNRYWYCDMPGYIGADAIDLYDLTRGENSYAYIIPCSDRLVKNSDYKNNVLPNNKIYTEKERLQFTLDLFIKNKLLPIFADDKITQLYKKIYFEKPILLKELQELQTQIKGLQTVTLLSSQFDYTSLLTKYDVKAIDESIIKYFHAIQQWTCELMDKLDYYEEQMETVIRDFNIISLKLSKKYEDNPHLTERENNLLIERQRYFKKRFSLDMYSVKSKILAIKKQADDLEYRIDSINSGENAIHELALLEKEERASFAFIAENTAEIIKNALLKIENFQNNHQFVVSAIDIWEKWSENYRVFKTTYFEDLKLSCENDGIEEEIWKKWYENWQSIRFEIEQKVQPIIERGLESSMPTVAKTEMSIPELLISALNDYKNGIDKFFIEDRKGIYQKFVFQAGGELQDKFETESELYKYTSSFQNVLQEIIFNCANAEDRVFILKWANSILDIQIDEVLEFVANNNLNEISGKILSEFATLKQKNYAVYLEDAKTYSEEKTRREKEYNSLIFKMRKDLMKR